MPSISFNVTQSDTILNTNVTAGTELTMSVSNPLEGTAYFTLETIPDNNGFYTDSTTKNLSGSFVLDSNTVGIVKDDYKMSAVVKPGTTEIVYTPAVNIVGTNVKVRGISGIPFTAPSFIGLLDTYSGAAAAYSLRQLSSTYSGDAIRVRRASDNTEQDIGFVNNELDTTSLASFCSGTNGFVTTWYDQSGNGNDATQSTAASQSQIVSSGSVITEGGKPCLEYNDDSYSSTYELTDDTDFLALIVIRVNTQNQTNPRYASFNSSTNSVNVQIGYNSASKYFTRKDNVTNTTTSTFTTTGSRNLMAHGCQSNTNYFSRNGSLQTFTDTGFPSANSTIGNGIHLLNAYDGSTFYVITGNIQEFILYPSDKLSDLSGIETNINDFYSIY